MSELGDVDVGCDLDCEFYTCCCAGFGCCRQKIEGTDDSVAFLAAGGTVVYANLKEGETITVDTESILAIEESVQMGVISNGRICCSLTCCCGGEGIFSTTLTGPGRVYMQVNGGNANGFVLFLSCFVFFFKRKCSSLTPVCGSHNNCVTPLC